MKNGVVLHIRNSRSGNAGPLGLMSDTNMPLRSMHVWRERMSSRLVISRSAPTTHPPMPILTGLECKNMRRQRLGPRTFGPTKVWVGGKEEKEESACLDWLDCEVI